MQFIIDGFGSLLAGLGITALLTVGAAIGSLLIGTLVTIARVSPIPVLRGAAFAYVQFFTNVPILALLILAVFALPDAGIMLPLTPTVMIVLAIYEAAYVAEAIRGGVNTIPNGQIEASRALGFKLSQTLGYVVVPQALRASVQPIANVMIALLMNSALAAAVGVVDLTAATNKLNLVAAQPVLIYTVSGLIYMAIALTIGIAAGRIERKVAILR